MSTQGVQTPWVTLRWMAQGIQLASSIRAYFSKQNMVKWLELSSTRGQGLWFDPSQHLATGVQQSPHQLKTTNSGAAFHRSFSGSVSLAVHAEKVPSF